MSYEAEPFLDNAADIASRLHELLAGYVKNGRPLTVASAESCTGGNVAARITANAGSSDYFLGGVVAYSNAAKAKLLQVSEEILKSKGAVSPECARAMAAGARRAFDSDVAVSTTGIAGPGGATKRKPVGLVFVALATSDEILVEEFHLPGDRATVTDAATEAALLMLLRGTEARR